MGVFFRRLKAFLLPFPLCGGLFTTFFSLCGAFFHYLKALLLRFSPFGAFFHHLKAFLLLFFSMWRPFFLRFSCVEGFPPPFEGLSATFFLHVGVLFLVLWGPFLACPTYPLPKFRRGLMPACPLIPMSSMQYVFPLSNLSTLRLLPTYHCTNKTYGRSTLMLTGITGTTHTLYGRLFMVSPIEPHPHHKTAP